jgi:diguanylate cyclase (GGDEF)-like protein
MRLTPSRVARLRAWIRYHIRPTELAVVFGGGVAFAVLHSVDAFDWFYQTTRSHEAWQLDEYANLFVIATIGLAVLLYVRAHRLAREIRRRRRAEAEARVLARHDPLTGIPNRRLFNERFDRCLAETRRAARSFALLSLDLNRFKAVNDIHGHTTGDRLLVAVAGRLRQLTRPEDSLARLGGDEFALAVCGADRDLAERVATRMVTALAQPFEIDGKVIEIGASVGIALYPGDADDASTLMQRADLAMYRAKAGGRNRHVFFDPVTDHVRRERTLLEVDLRQAVATDALVPYYQPLVSLEQGRIVGFEMLARWDHPARGVLPPDLFIPIAEDIGLIGELSMNLIRRALKDAATWDPTLFLSVNIAPDQFRDPGLAEAILAALAEADFPPGRLEVELTETALVADLQTARMTISKLKDAGVRIAIDDFGKGYSSLYYLRELPFDVVKIDQAFVNTRRTNQESPKIIAAVIGLSEALGLTTVAEGIEEGIDADWLRAQGCKVGQGYFYSRPLPAAEMARLLSSPLAA